MRVQKRIDTYEAVQWRGDNLAHVRETFPNVKFRIEGPTLLIATYERTYVEPEDWLVGDPAADYVDVFNRAAFNAKYEQAR